MESGAISDGQISASTSNDENHTGRQGRLYYPGSEVYGGSWSSATNDANQWLQVDLNSYYTKVTRIATQGRHGAQFSQWVSKYNLEYSDNGVNFQYYKEQGQTVKKVKQTVSNNDDYQLSRQRTFKYVGTKRYIEEDSTA